MPTLFDPTVRAATLERVARLTPDRQALWGRFSAPAMVSHLNSALRQALGELPATPARGAMAHWPINWLVIHLVPWPRGKAQSPAAFLGTPAGPWDDDLNLLRDLIQRFGARGPQAAWPVSSAFGRISGTSWGVLEYRHLAHHLDQFGV